MDKPLARQLIREFSQLDAGLNAASSLAESIPDEAERRQLRRALSEVTLDVYGKLMQPIIRQYPDLDPDEAGA